MRLQTAGDCTAIGNLDHPLNQDCACVSTENLKTETAKYERFYNVMYELSKFIRTIPDYPKRPRYYV